jgi:hypothetical protein
MITIKPTLAIFDDLVVSVTFAICDVITESRSPLLNPLRIIILRNAGICLTVEEAACA